MNSVFLVSTFDFVRETYADYFKFLLAEKLAPSLNSLFFILCIFRYFVLTFLKCMLNILLCALDFLASLMRSTKNSFSLTLQITLHQSFPVYCFSGLDNESIDHPLRILSVPLHFYHQAHFLINLFNKDLF